jgi:uncharacterized protein YjbJ (UPF0337 family)
MAKGTGDQMKGRVKKAAGDITDNPNLQQEGQVDEDKGKVKNFVDKTGDKVKDTFKD